MLKYCENIDYLGVIISDGGLLRLDVQYFVDNKRSNVSIKFLNFCKINCNDPLSVKLDVLDKCVTSSLLYASETWAKNTHDVEFVYRLGIKVA